MEEQQANYQPQGPSISNGNKLWMIISGILLIVVIVLAFLMFLGAGGEDSLNADEAGSKALNYVNSVYQAGATLKSVSEASGVYSVVVTSKDFAGQQRDTEIFITKDGRLYFPQGIDIDQELNAIQAGN
ncbi:MAG: hypothetical protein COT81_02770 [Candidatus Buchananbacteria bacterium CG10_big_fil_rev_8_21_14_0_10_42_9]|uniref:Uncharacterized protein n=1 Tax=Candidatus Buchananbacteria bacterium CG10_big_fil_rev_8_21_14_0_10_42_9 TaxID=1974526 RepID=A0A2H0W188_9BACT|nr:MAG: hypothetical protein COT81_02770 [Candidatus Buchananbacteria bacterium CG10_big_fil_rev_8_21_14_0_10_42_9]